MLMLKDCIQRVYLVLYSYYYYRSTVSASTTNEGSESEIIYECDDRG